MASLKVLFGSKDRVKQLFVIFALLLPFEYIPHYTLGSLSIRLSTLVGLAIILVAIKRILSGTIKLKSLGWQRWLLVSWVLWIAVGLVQVEDWSSAAKVVLPLAFLVATALAASFLWRREYLESALKALLLGAAIAAIFGFYQFIGNYLGLSNSLTGIREPYSWQSFGFPRMQSTALEPLFFSAYLLLPIGVLATLMAKYKAYQRKGYFLLLGALLLADLLTLSRGGLAALIVMMVLISTLSWRPGLIRKNAKALFAGFDCTVVVFGAALGVITLVGRQGNDSDLTYNKKGVQTFLTHLSDFHFFANSENKAKDDSISQRDKSRTQALRIIKENSGSLLFGVGAGQYELHAKALFGSQAYGTPNNIELEQTAQSGLIGLGLLVAFGLSLLWGLRIVIKKTSGVQRITATVLFAYLVALIIQAQTFSGLVLTHLWFVIGLALFLLAPIPHGGIDARVHVSERKHPVRKKA